MVFASLPTPADMCAGRHRARTGWRKASVPAPFGSTSQRTRSTSCAALQRASARKGVHFLDAPVSGGPAGANSGKLAIWVGGDKAIFDKYKAQLDAMGDQALYIGAIGAGTIAKLVHNAAGAAVNVVLSEVFTMGVKAGVEPLPIVRRDPSGCRRAGASCSIGCRSSSSPGCTIRRISRYGCCTRTSRWRANSRARSACRCG